MEAVHIAAEDLCANISKSLGLIGELTNISKDKEAFLTKCDIEGLRNATEKEEEIVAALNRTEKDRKICADVLSQAVGLFDKDNKKKDSNNITLRDIIEKITDKKMRERLSVLRKELIEAADHLSVLNDRLGQLLQLQIGLTDYMINLLYIPKSRNHSYNIQGIRRDETRDLSLLDLHI
jgi:hypothetical protein